MWKLMCAGALAAAFGTMPALAQGKDTREYRAAKLVTGPDVSVVEEAVREVGLDGECTVTFKVGIDGKAMDIRPDCTPEAYAPYAVRAMASVEYTPEIFAGEVMETEDIKQPFSFGAATGPAADPRGEKAPVLVKDFVPADIRRAIDRVKKSGACDVTFTVGANGEPKNIKPNCTPGDFDRHIKDAVEKLRFEPGQKDGKAVEWPDFKQPLNLSNEN